MAVIHVEVDQSLRSAAGHFVSVDHVVVHFARQQRIPASARDLLGQRLICRQVVSRSIRAESVERRRLTGEAYETRQVCALTIGFADLDGGAPVLAIAGIVRRPNAAMEVTSAAASNSSTCFNFEPDPPDPAAKDQAIGPAFAAPRARAHLEHPSLRFLFTGY